MDSKSSTDIDRKLAIYYHPLFQQVIKLVLNLFCREGQRFEIGLFQFVEFNLKLQKSLLPTFDINNALVSGLNDWVKEVAQCLGYEGMVSTTDCVQITPHNIRELIEKEYSASKIAFFTNKHQFINQMEMISTHDAFKLLGVKINKEVFSKFMFDLCSTWCQFLDVELFTHFLVGLYFQISEGDNLELSLFKDTLKIQNMDLQLLQQFQELKSKYNKVHRKQLRYYRAWCQWNYLRVNQMGQKLILKMDEIKPDDNRVLQLATVFEKAINVINMQITSQNPNLNSNSMNINVERPQREMDQDSKQQFLTTKTIGTRKYKNNEKEVVDYASNDGKTDQNYNQSPHQYYEENDSPDYNGQASNEYIPNFEIEVDAEGNMYLKMVLRMPVFGTKIHPRPFEEKSLVSRQYFEMKKKQYRQTSNLYRRMDKLTVRLKHNTKNDPYILRKNNKNEQNNENVEKEKGKSIHQKVGKETQKLKQKKQKTLEPFFPQKEEKVSISENKDYIHKVMAPAFLTDDQNNISYAKIREGEIYATSANDEKRDLKIGMPKLRHMQFRVKQLKSYHVVGKLISDRDLINEKVRAASISMNRGPIKEKSLIENLKEENRHIWSKYIKEEEMDKLNDYHEFYAKLEESKRKFGLQFQSQFRLNLRPMLAYQNKRYQLGGVLTRQDQERFTQRMAKLINKQNRKLKRRAKKQKARQYRNSFKSKKDKSLFEDIFLGYHKEVIKNIKQERKRYNSVIGS